MTHPSNPIAEAIIRGMCDLADPVSAAMSAQAREPSASDLRFVENMHRSISGAAPPGWPPFALYPSPIEPRAPGGMKSFERGLSGC